MNGIIRTFTENIEVKCVSSIQVVEEPDSLNRLVDVVKFYDSYGNSKDVRFASFLGLSFDKAEEVMVALKDKFGDPHHTWLQDTRNLVCIPSEKLLIFTYTSKEGEARTFSFNLKELFEIVFEDEDLPEYDYELLIHYLNGETDEYYKRTAGKRWETEARTKEEALEEMKRIDPDTFEEMAKCENVDYYEVAEVKYKVVGNEVVENIDDEIVTFDTYAEAFDQTKEWKKLDKHEGWDDEYRIIEVIA